MAPISTSTPSGGAAVDSLGITADGSVCAATAAGLLVVELASTPGEQPHVVTRVQAGVVAEPREVARFPLRRLLAMVLARLRARRRGHPAKLHLPMVPLPQALRHAYLVALVKFLSVNFEKLLWAAHAWGHPHAPLRDAVRRAMRLAMRGSRAIARRPRAG